MHPKHADCQTFPHPDNKKRPVGVEPTLPPWQGSRLPLHHGRKIASQPNCQRSRMHEASKEHRVGIEPTSPRYDGGIFPLDDQCLLFVSVGPVRIELTSFGLRDRRITLSATIPNGSIVSFQSAWKGLNLRPVSYRDTALTTELHAVSSKWGRRGSNSHRTD